MSDFSTASQLETPIVEAVDGVDVSFPRLTMDDLSKWAGEIQNKRVLEAKTRHTADKSLSPFDRQSLIQRIIDTDIELASVQAKSFTPDGIKKALIVSLKKSGKSDVDALAVLSRIHYRRQYELAQEVLSAPAPVQPEGDGSENPPTGGDTAVTGDSTAP